MVHFSSQERTALFIDGANLYAATRSLGFDIDYRRLLDYFAGKTNLLRAYYYSALLETEEYSPLKPLTDWLAYNGYSLVTKPAKEFVDTLGRRRIKGNMDIELAIDMLELAPKLDHAILFSGDSRFPPPRRGRAAQGRARLGYLHHQDLPADDRRRVAPAGGPICGTGGHRPGFHPAAPGRARPHAGR